MVKYKPKSSVTMGLSSVLYLIAVIQILSISHTNALPATVTVTKHKTDNHIIESGDYGGAKHARSIQSEKTGNKLNTDRDRSDKSDINFEDSTFVKKFNSTANSVNGTLIRNGNNGTSDDLDTASSWGGWGGWGGGPWGGWGGGWGGWGGGWGGPWGGWGGCCGGWGGWGGPWG